MGKSTIPSLAPLIAVSDDNWFEISTTGDNATATSKRVSAKMLATYIPPATIPSAPLTTEDDANITLTLGGTPDTALLQAASITAGWTGELSVERGGTGSDTAEGARTNLGVEAALGLKANLAGGNIFTGAQIFNGSTAETAVFTLNPLPSSAGVGLVINQTSAGSAVAPNLAALYPNADTYSLNTINSASTLGLSPANGTVNGLSILHTYGGSNINSIQQGLYVQGNLFAPSNVSNTNGNYCAATFFQAVGSNDNGTSGSPRGNFFGLNPTVLAYPGATFLQSVVAVEVDIGMASGSSAVAKSGIAIAQFINDAVQGTSIDAAIWVGNQTGTAPGWRTGILFSNNGANKPFSSDGTILQTQGAMTLANGIDAASATFTGNSINFGGTFIVTGAGAVTQGAWNGSLVQPLYGGTGIGNYTIGDILYASGTTTLSRLADVAAGNVLLSGGVGVAPSWGKPNASNLIGTTLASTVTASSLTSFGNSPTLTGTPVVGGLSLATGSGYSSITDTAPFTVLTFGPSGDPQTWIDNTIVQFRLRDKTTSTAQITSSGLALQSAGAKLTVNSATMITTTTSFTNGAAAAAGTLSNAPTAGNPTKWVPINDNGTTRYIPAW